MSDKTLRQIGAEAQKHREDYVEAVDYRERQWEGHKELARTLADRYSSLRDKGYFVDEHGNQQSPSVEEYRRAFVDTLGEDAVALSMGEDFEPSIASYRAHEHYKDNEAAYHDLAVSEAALDDVKINVGQPFEGDQRVVVPTSSQK